MKYFKFICVSILVLASFCFLSCSASSEQGSGVAYIKNGDSKITSLVGLVGEEYFLEFGIEDEENVDASWKSSDNNILKISFENSANCCLATIKLENEGTATLSVTSSNGKTANVEVTSIKGEISSSISEDNVVLFMKQGQDIFDFGSTIFSNTELFAIIYSANNDNVQVDNNGVITAKQVGESIVSAKLGKNLSCDIKVIVKAILETSSENIVLYDDSFDAPYNYEDTIICYPIDSEIEYHFSSGNICLDVDGNIVTNGAGSYTITASIKGLPDYYVVTDVEVKPSRTFNIISKDIVTKVGEEIAIPVLTSFSDLTYQVKNSSIARISDGKIIPLAKGSTVIKILRNDKELGSINIDVISQTPSVVSLSYNYKDMSFVNVYGRNYYDSEQRAVIMSYGGAGFEVKFCGTELSANFIARLNSESLYMQVLVDGEQVSFDSKNILKDSIAINGSTAKKYTIVDDLPYGVHTVKVLRRSMYNSGEIGLLSLETDGFLIPAPQKAKLKIDIYGDSITAGYGVCDGIGWNSANSNGLLTYGYLLGEKLGAQTNMMGHSGWGVYVSTGNILNPATQWYDKVNVIQKSNQTWDLSSYVPDLVIINLGTNDASGVSGNYNSAQFISCYKTMINSILEEAPNAYVLLCYGMMGRNSTVNNDIEQVVKQLGNEKVTYLPLENFGCWDGLNGHPTPEGNKLAAEYLYDYIVENYSNLIKSSNEEEDLRDNFGSIDEFADINGLTMNR